MAEILLGMFQLNKYKSYLPIIYKLLNDLLFVLLIFFTVAMIGEAVLPIIIAVHLGIYKWMLLVLLDVLAISFLGKKLQLKSEKFLNKKTSAIFLAVAIIFLINSVLKISFYLIPIVVIISLFSIYYLYQVLTEENK